MTSSASTSGRALRPPWPPAIFLAVLMILTFFAKLLNGSQGVILDAHRLPGQVRQGVTPWHTNSAAWNCAKQPGCTRQPGCNCFLVIVQHRTTPPAAVPPSDGIKPGPFDVAFSPRGAFVFFRAKVGDGGINRRVKKILRNRQPVFKEPRADKNPTTPAAGAGHEPQAGQNRHSLRQF